MKRRTGWNSTWIDMKKRTASILMLVLISGVLFGFAAKIQQSIPEEKDKAVQTSAQQPPAKDRTVQDQIQTQPERIVAGPRNVKERTALYVFIAWLWAAIIILIYITRLEIKEADRLLELKFYRGEKK